MEKLASVMPYVDYIMASGMEKSAINVSKFVNGARGIASRLGGYITGTGKDVAKGVEAYDKGIADITGRRQAIDEFMNNVVNNKVSKTAVDDLASKYGLNEAQQANLRLFQKFHTGVGGDYKGIDEIRANVLRNMGASDAQIAKHTRDLGRDFYKQYGRNAARNARAGRMAIGGTAAAGALGVGGYALGHSNGVDSGIEDFKANHLPQYLTRAATIGHMAAQNQANNAGFMDRLGYLFTGNSGSLNMNNPIQRQPSGTTGGFMA